MNIKTLKEMHKVATHYDKLRALVQVYWFTGHVLLAMMCGCGLAYELYVCAAMCTVLAFMHHEWYCKLCDKLLMKEIHARIGVLLGEGIK